MEKIRKVEDFIAKAGVFYLTTVDGDRPRCRPLGFHQLIGDKLYFGVGDFKDVYRQMRANPNVEICATDADNDFIRYCGRAVFEESYDIAEKALDAAPPLKEIYNEKTGYKLAVFHLENAEAEFHSMFGIKEKISFD